MHLPDGFTESKPNMTGSKNLCPSYIFWIPGYTTASAWEERGPGLVPLGHQPKSCCISTKFG